MINSYDYQKPEETYTLDQFIACQSDTVFCYNNTSFIDQIDNIKYNVYNVASDYIDELRHDYCVNVQLSDDQAARYKYRPKLLAYDIYGIQELYFLLLIINDICSIKEFTMKRLRLPMKEDMKDITKNILNSNRKDIIIYNDANVRTSYEIEDETKIKRFWTP